MTRFSNESNATVIAAGIAGLASIIAAILSGLGVAQGNKIEEQFKQYEQSKQFSDLIIAGIEDFTKPDSIEGKLRYLAVYRLAPDDKNKLYLTRIATDAKLAYLADSIGELLNDEFSDRCQEPNKKDENLCNKYEDIKEKLGKLIEPSEEAKRERSARDANPEINEEEAKRQAKEGLTDVPATDATKVAEEDNKLNVGNTGWVYIGMITKENAKGKILSGTITTSSRKEPIPGAIITTEKPVTLRDGASSINTKRLGYLMPGSKLEVTEVKVSNLIKDAKGIWVKVVISDIGSS